MIFKKTAVKTQSIGIKKKQAKMFGYETNMFAKFHCNLRR
jgi:hypothetical protein